MRKKIIGIIVVVILLNLLGCGSGKMITESFTRENTSVTQIRSLAVMPFEGGGRAQRIRELTITNLLASGLFDVQDIGRVDSVLKREGIAQGAPIDLFDIRRLGETLNVQGLLFGSVEQTTGSRGSARFAEITVTFRLIETETGILLWQASGKGSGYSFLDRLFGFRPKDDFVVTLDMLNEIFATMQ